MSDLFTKKVPAFYLFTGIAFFVLGLGNITCLVNPDGIYDILLGIVGVLLVYGGINLLKQYKKVR